MVEAVVTVMTVDASWEWSLRHQDSKDASNNVHTSIIAQMMSG